jgi:hypothetical protein
MSSVVKKVIDGCNDILANLRFAFCPGYNDQIHGKRSITDLPDKSKPSDFIKELEENTFYVYSIKEETQTHYIFKFSHDELFEDELFKCTLTLCDGYVVEILIELA